MTSPVQTQEQKPTAVETPNNSKEYNFRALEAKLQQERTARLEAEKKAMEAERMAQEAVSRKQTDDDDDDSEPYVDKKRLNKQLGKFGQQVKQETQSEIKQAVHQALYEERKQNWIKQNPDFFDTMQHAESFAQQNPELAETILEMPDSFERQKLVYKTIKSMGVDKPKSKEPSIQEKIDQNRRSPYYQPSGVAAAPYSNGGDFSPAGQKNAYAKLQELKARLRM